MTNPVDCTFIKDFIQNEISTISEIMNSKTSQDVQNQMLEYSLMKIITNVDIFVSDSFYKYASGSSSVSGYKPVRRLEFESVEHVGAFFDSLKQDNKLDSFSKGLNEYTKHIFSTKDDPFATILSISSIWESYLEAKIIRNYITHKRGNSEAKFKDKFGIEPKATKSPATVLLEPIKDKTGKTQSRYSRICNDMLELCEILTEPRPFIK